MLLTLKFRLKDACATELGRQARAVNFVWNYCNETQQKAARAPYQTMHWRELPDGGAIGAGSFNQDARGRWYINMPVEFPDESFAKSGYAVVGIDLGLKDLATLSTGEKIEAPKHYRRHEARLGKAQRAGKKRLARAISAKIANCRKDHLHKASARIALAHGVIFVGNVSSKKLARTRLAKSVLDAGWSTLRTQLSYKAIRHGGLCIEVDEAQRLRPVPHAARCRNGGRKVSQV